MADMIATTSSNSPDHVVTFHESGSEFDRFVLVRSRFPGAFTINKHFYFAIRAENHNLRFSFYPLSATTVGDVNELSVFVPICFVEIERVFPELTIKSHESLVINAIAVTFATMSCTEVEHIPDKAAPYEVTRSDLFPVLHMIEELVVLWVPVRRCRRYDQVLGLLEH